ncbi:MAG: response regulator [Bacteroidetes bacterium]|nr:response regulator [Bacteroidota bacterium]MBU1117228.1 response regulator [Bacteroidota bacterium]MBU1800292.1 response regulator [Bacteroidota bacterium]
MVYKKKPTLLYLEDDELTLSFYERYFRSEYNFIGVKTPNDFRDAVKKYIVDIILIDIAIKNAVNGLDLTKEIRDNYLYKDLPIICVTAHVTFIDRERAKEAGVTKFVSKPVNSAFLKNEIENCLEQTNN